MTQPHPSSFNAALRGAVDLSGLSRPRPQAPTGQPGAAAGSSGGAAPGASAAGSPAAGGTDGVLVQGTDATFNTVVTGTTSVPGVLVLFTDQIPESAQFVQTLAQEAVAQEGRFRVIAVDIAANPGIVQALTPVLQEAFGQVSALPVVVGLLAGQPVPFFLGAQPIEQVRTLLEQFLAAAVANGVTGRVESVPQGQGGADGQGGPGADGAATEGGAAEPELPPLHQQAYDAIDAGDLDAAAAAYEQALAENPKDEDARLGLGQVQLLNRTQHLDLNAVRATAAAEPDNIEAQVQAADLDLVGGHVEDAFLRLIDVVRRTAGDERDTVRQHVLGQFEVIGTSDPRVAKARQSLMSALY